jgi:hypothetical protein
LYVVAVERAALVPSVTFRLPADAVFGFDEQLVTIDVADLGASDSMVEPPPVDPGPVVGEFAAPLVGEAVSLLARDSEPIWIVRHDDGSVSAVPGIIRVLPEFGEGPAGFSMLVIWSSTSRRFVAPAVWDEWGRALVDGRHTDLAQFTAELVGERVVVRQSTATRVAGEPFFGGVPPEFGAQRPELPALIEMPAELPTGWSHVIATLVRVGDVYHVCAGRYGFDVLGPLTCPADAPLAPITGGPPLEPDAAIWFAGPIVLHVADDGAIDELVVLGGSGGVTAAPMP